MGGMGDMGGSGMDMNMGMGMQGGCCICGECLVNQYTLENLIDHSVQQLAPAFYPPAMTPATSALSPAPSSSFDRDYYIYGTQQRPRKLLVLALSIKFLKVCIIKC